MWSAKCNNSKIGYSYFGTEARWAVWVNHDVTPVIFQQIGWVGQVDVHEASRPRFWIGHAKLKSRKQIRIFAVCPQSFIRVFQYFVLLLSCNCGQNVALGEHSAVLRQNELIMARSQASWPESKHDTHSPLCPCARMQTVITESVAWFAHVQQRYHAQVEFHLRWYLLLTTWHSHVIVWKFTNKPDVPVMKDVDSNLRICFST